MALRRYGNQRDANEHEIIRVLEQAGCTVIKLDTPVDLAVGRCTPRGPRTFFLEVKTEKGKLTPDQVEFFDTWKGHAAIVRNEDEALKAIGVLR